MKGVPKLARVILALTEVGEFPFPAGLRVVSGRYEKEVSRARCEEEEESNIEKSTEGCTKIASNRVCKSRFLSLVVEFR